jgi:folate-binding protein YgfZ
MKAALLTDRGMIHVSGPDARGFLHGLVTHDVAHLEPGTLRHAALLSPQGKMVADFLVAAIPDGAGEGFLLDVPLAPLPELIKKLMFYRLRAKVAIEDASANITPLAVWETEQDPGIDPGGRDTRHPALGFRAYIDPAAAADAAREIGASLEDRAAFHAHRIALGVPEGGKDYLFGDTFPHEANMDQLEGIDFKKGCFIGQEVVSRMQHRNTARTRVVPVVFPEGFAGLDGSEVRVGEKPAGMMGTSAGDKGLAFLRLDRVADGLGEGQALTAGGVPFVLAQKPHWVRFPWPGEAGAGSAS